MVLSLPLSFNQIWISLNVFWRPPFSPSPDRLALQVGSHLLPKPWCPHPRPSPHLFLFWFLPPSLWAQGFHLARGADPLHLSHLHGPLHLIEGGSDTPEIYEMFRQSKYTDLVFSKYKWVSNDTRKLGVELDTWRILVQLKIPQRQLWTDPEIVLIAANDNWYCEQCKHIK